MSRVWILCVTLYALYYVTMTMAVVMVMVMVLVVRKIATLFMSSFIFKWITTIECARWCAITLKNSDDIKRQIRTFIRSYSFTPSLTASICCAFTFFTRCLSMIKKRNVSLFRFAMCSHLQRNFCFAKTMVCAKRKTELNGVKENVSEKKCK